MIKKQKQKAITLISMVITIIILLILVGISIASLTGNGIFEKAKLAKEKQEVAQKKEEEILNNFQKLINNSNRDEADVNTSKDIEDFTPIIVNAEYDYIKVKTSKIESNGVDIVGYAYLLNDEVVGYTREKEYTFEDLQFNTEYKISVIAMDKKGKIKKSTQITQKTVDGMFLYNRGKVGNGVEFPIISQVNGNYTTYNIDEDRITMNGTNNLVGDQTLMLTNYIDITNYKYLSIYADCNGKHTNSYVTIGIGKNISIIPWGGLNNVTKKEYLPNANRQITTIDISEYSSDYQIFISLIQGMDADQSFIGYKLYLHN